MRPSDDILSEFYGLADLDSRKRLNAISRLLMKIRLNSSAQEYCVERLVTGLSSSRGAARLGYSSALCVLLMEFHELWTTDKLFELAEKKLDLHDKENGKANAIAHHLLVSAIFRSNMYSEASVVLLEHELEIYRACPSLGMSVAQLVAEFVEKMDKKTFKAVLPLIRDYLDSALTRFSVEFVYLALLLKDRFPSYIAEIVSFVQKDGSCIFSESDLTFLLLTVKKCDSSALEPFLKLLLTSSRRSGQFRDVYTNVVEKWCTSGDESKVLERIFDTAKLTLSSGGATHKEILAVFSPFLLKRIVQIAHGKRSAQNRILREKITDFCEFVKSFLSSIEDDTDLLEVIETLDTNGSFDSLTGSNLIGNLIGRLSHDGVAKWIQTADKAWSLRHICAAFPHWRNETKVETILALLQRPKSEELQYAVGNCISCLFKMKVRAGTWVSVSLIEGGEEVLRQVVTKILGKHIVKDAIKRLDGSACYERTLVVFWMCLTLWSKAAWSSQMSEGYFSNAEELFMVVKDGEESLKVLLDQLMALLSQPLKYHRTVVYYVFVHLLKYVKDEHISHIIQTLMMTDDELVDEQDSDASSSNNEENGTGVDEHADEESESDSFNDDEVMDTETLSRLENSLGKAAVKRKAGAVDEEETDVSDVDDAEMFEMDDRLAAAFKSIAPRKENKLAAHLASVFRVKLSDLLLFVLSSTSSPSNVKIHMIVPLVRLAKLQLKQNPESQIYRKTMGLLNIVSHLKKVHLADEEVVSLLDQLVQECIGISNPILASTAASLSSFIFSLGISSDGMYSETVLSAFTSLFERFMTQEDGLIGSDLAVAAIVKHPEAFVSKSKIFLRAGFNEDYRIFRRTAALLCLSTIMGKNVLHKVQIEKSFVKGIGKSSTQYLSASLSQPDLIKPRFFASVLKLLLSVAGGVPDEYKSTLQKHLALECLTEDEETWNEISKRINSACQQVCGKSPASVLSHIQKLLA